MYACTCASCAGNATNTHKHTLKNLDMASRRSPRLHHNKSLRNLTVHTALAYSLYNTSKHVVCLYQINYVLIQLCSTPSTLSPLSVYLSVILPLIHIYIWFSSSAWAPSGTQPSQNDPQIISMFKVDPALLAWTTGKRLLKTWICQEVCFWVRSESATAFWEAKSWSHWNEQRSWQPKRKWQKEIEFWNSYSKSQLPLHKCMSAKPCY